MIDRPRRAVYNLPDEASWLGASVSPSPQGTSRVDRPLLQQPLTEQQRANRSESRFLPSSLRRLLGHLPYDVVRVVAHSYRRLQVFAWPDEVRREVAAAGVGYTSATGHAPGSRDYDLWERCYRRYALCSLPAQLAAIAVTRRPRHIEHRLYFQEGAAASIIGPHADAIFAVSRTGLAFVIPWLLTAHGRNVVIVANPSERAAALLRALPRWSESGRIDLLAADARALLGTRRRLTQGDAVVIFPESFGKGGRRARVSFINATVNAPIGTAALSQLTGRPVQPVCATSRGSGSEITAGTPLEPGEFDSPEEMTEALFRQLAAWADEHPAEWVGWSELAAHLGERHP